MKPARAKGRYAWIVFDADGTLFDYDAAEAAALTASFAKIGRSCPPEYSEIYREINGRMWLKLERGTTTQTRIRAERFEKLFEAIGIDSDPVRFSEDYLTNLADRTELIGDAAEVVAALAQVSRLLLMTNGIPRVQRPRFEASMIREHFAAILISEEVGAAKPDPLIFDAAFAAMNHPQKKDVLVVGDSLTSDIKGGVDYGIDTCWFNPSGLPCPANMAPTYEIRRINQVLEIAGQDPR